MKTKSVLVVDDEVTFRETLKMALNKWGYSVYCADDGQEALETFRQRKSEIGVVLSDVIIPGIDGLALLRAVRKVNPDTLVILFSAYPTIHDAVTAMREGAKDYLTKPFDYDRLKFTLERFFQWRDAEPTSRAG